MSDDRKLIEGVWRRIEERERDLKILDGLERKDENDVVVVAKELFEKMGIRGLFYGITDVIALSMIVCICVFTGIAIYLRQDPQYVYSMAFIFSPTLYACIFCLAYIKETQINTISVQMSCRYTFFHVLLVRMLLNSGLAMVFNLIYIGTLNRLMDMNPVKALALSFSSLMLFSVMQLKMLTRKNKLLGFARTAVMWLGVNLLVFNGARDLYMGFMDRIPLGVLAAAVFLLGAVYWRELKKIIRSNYKSSLVKYQ